MLYIYNDISMQNYSQNDMNALFINNTNSIIIEGNNYGAYVLDVLSSF
jgi:hypothetical protein